MPSESPSDGIFLRFSGGGQMKRRQIREGGKRRQTDAVIPAQAGI
ncbi:hypothetical protein [Neisseria bergeri]|nr:hypothetical protein [Neisseria bergeri]